MYQLANMLPISRGTMRRVSAALLLTLSAAIPPVSLADTTAVTGNSQPFSTQQPSLAVNYLVTLEGIFQDLGEVIMFGGSFEPRGYAFADGRLMLIDQNDALFAKIGTTYGGDGQTTFALPDLRGRTPIGQGTGSGLSSRTLGETTGAVTQTLSEAQLPSHNHSMPAPNDPTTFAGSGQPMNNMQPALVMNYGITEIGIFPPRNLTGDGSNLGSQDAFIASVGLYAGPSLPNNVAPADGHLNSIAQNTALFALVGTTYGGNGQTTYAVPDLRGRAALHSGQGPGLSDYVEGQVSGAEQTTMSLGQMPIHDHKLPPTLDSTGLVGGSQPMNNMQPYLGLNYMIALQGIYPQRNLADSNLAGENLAGAEPFVGEIALFAASFAPQGWAFADGQLLSINQNQALFSLLGTTYGGDGQTTFALPDLRGRVAIGMGQGPGLPDYVLGESFGAETLSLTVNQLAAHDHDYTQVPEPSTLLLAACGAMGLFVMARRKR